MKLREYLHENQIKPSIFAERIGVAPSTITRILKGERTPRIGLVARITSATNNSVSLSDFLPEFVDGVGDCVACGGSDADSTACGGVCGDMSKED